MLTDRIVVLPVVVLIGLFTLSDTTSAQKAGSPDLLAVQDVRPSGDLAAPDARAASTGACEDNRHPLPPQLLDQLQRLGPSSPAAGAGRGRGRGSLNLSVSPYSTVNQGEAFNVSWDGVVGQDYKLCWKRTGTLSYDCASPHVSANNSNTWSGKTYAGIYNLDCETEYKVKVKRVGGIGWSKVRETTLSCGCPDPCPEGGYYDGANCQIGEAPEGTTAFIYANNYYYTPVPTSNCPYPGSSWDGANCRVGDVPTGATGFIWENHWYYGAYPSTTNPCPHGGYYDSANCQVGEAPWGTQAFIWGGGYYYTALPDCPYPGSVYDGVNCYVQPVPPGTNGFIWLDHWYYEACP